MAYQWVDILEGECPPSLRDLPCDCWAVKEDPEPGTHILLCLLCGWYRRIPEADLEAARALEEAVEAFTGGWLNAMEAPDA